MRKNYLCSLSKRCKLVSQNLRACYQTVIFLFSRYLKRYSQKIFEKKSLKLGETSWKNISLYFGRPTFNWNIRAFKNSNWWSSTHISISIFPDSKMLFIAIIRLSRRAFNEMECWNIQQNITKTHGTSFNDWLLFSWKNKTAW
jgi:hypothetical protein